MNNINIAFAINHPYLFYCMVTILSLIKHADVNDYLNIYIVHDGSLTNNNIYYYLNNIPVFKKYNNYNIILINITTHINFSKINFSYNHWGKEVFYKILFPSLFNKLDKILYLDTDTIAKGSLFKVYNTQMNNYLFLGCSIGKNGTNKNNLIGNINCGSLLLNLKQLRLENIEDQWLHHVYKDNNNEETVINNYFYNRLIYTNKFYCISKRQPKITIQDLNKAIIIHYVARKPWISRPFCRYSYKFYNLWYKNITHFIQQTYMYKYYIFKFYILNVHRFIFSITNRLSKLEISLFKKLHSKVVKYGTKTLQKYTII